jgi:multisubunit Na+/H+ antiporter MnhC subunit
MISKILTRGVLMIVLTLVLLNSVSAFAVSAKYNDGNPLYILPGESKEVPFILQNLDGTSDIRVKLEVNTGKEFIKINDPSDIYTVPAGSKTSVSLTMTVPADAKVNDIYPVSLNFVTLSNGASGTFSLSGAISQNFNAIIGTGNPPVENKINYVLIILTIVIALAIGAIIYYLITRKKKKNSKKKKH